MKANVLIVHGTEGHPEENWFPWLKKELERNDFRVFVPQFPSPPVVQAKIEEWFEVLKDYEQFITEETIFIGHSLGGIFTLRILEKRDHAVKAACFAGTPIGIDPILNYERDKSFSGFEFDFENIKKKAEHFMVFQSDDDPYVGLKNGEELADKLGVELSFIPSAGHFHEQSGYVTFPLLRDKILQFYR